MPPRSKVEMLEPDLRAELDRRLQGSGFSGYEQLSAWLKEQGVSIGKSALHSYGQDFEARLGSLKRVTAQARAIVAESPDDDGAVNDALIRLVQEKLFDILMELDVDPTTVKLNQLGKVIADLARASISQKRLATEIRKDAADKAMAALENGLAKSGQRLSPEALRAVREDVYGIIE